MPKPVGAAWRSLSWAVEADHELVAGRPDRVAVRLVRPKVGGAGLVVLFESRPEPVAVRVCFEADDAFDSTSSAALRAPIAHLVADAAGIAAEYFQRQGAKVAEAGLEAKVANLRELDRLAQMGVAEPDALARAFFDLWQTATVAASTRNRPIAWIAEALEIDRATVHRWIARGRELETLEPGELPDAETTCRGMGDGFLDLREAGKVLLGEEVEEDAEA